MDIKNIEIKDELEKVMYAYFFGHLGNNETLEKINKNNSIKGYGSLFY